MVKHLNNIIILKLFLQRQCEQFFYIDV